MATAATKLLTGLAAGALIAGAAQAQTAPQQGQQQQQAPQQAQQPDQQQPSSPQQPQQQAVTRPRQELAQQCMRELQSLSARMEEDGYWIAGWGNRWGGYPGPYRGDAATTGAAGWRTDAAGPWGPQARFGINSPRYQIRILYSAANVLAHRGDREGCTRVVAELGDLYTNYVEELRQSGVEPGRVTSWRQERIVAAQPVKQLNRPVSIDDVTGTQLRNAQDERLGSIHDVIVDPQSGQISHVLVARGGFLGFGEDHVVVPWQALRATTDLNLFVLNVREQVMDQAPTVDTDQIGDESLFQQQRKRAEEYWQKHMKG